MRKFLDYLNRNKENIIRLVYLLPILFSVIVSINHVISWYQLANPDVWAVYLSIGVEVAALVTVVAIIFGKPGWHIYTLFIVVTLIQFIGNIFYSYQFIDENGVLFTQWNEFINTITGFPQDIKSNRLWLAVLSGASAPLMSLLSLHLLSKFEMKEKKNDIVIDITNDREEIPETVTFPITHKSDDSENIQVLNELLIDKPEVKQDEQVKERPILDIDFIGTKEDDEGNFVYDDEGYLVPHEMNEEDTKTITEFIQNKKKEEIQPNDEETLIVGDDTQNNTPQSTESFDVDELRKKMGEVVNRNQSTPTPIKITPKK